MEIKQKFTKFRNKLNKRLQIARNNYYKNEFTSVQNNMQLLWNKINKSLGKKKPTVDQTIG